MLIRFPALFFALALQAGGQETAGKPTQISKDDLKDFDKLPVERRELLEVAIEVGKEAAGLPYKFGGNSPKDGGFDCSGAMVYVMSKVGLKPPRTSSDQFLWVEKMSELHRVPATANSLEDASLKELQPGDLLFWAGTYAPVDGRKTRVTHVAMFLGYEKKDGRAVMINATDGRTYRGKAGNGYGVYDFRIPKPGGRTKFLGYGTPPGLGK